MSDTYVECLVSRGVSTAAKFVRVLLVMLTAAFLLLGMLGIILAFVAGVLFGVLTYFVYMRTDIEYEYLYLDKEIKIDKIMNKSKRKKVGTFEVERMEIFAPLNSYHLDNYKNRQVKVLDYSSGKEQKPETRYALYYEGSQKLILEPTPAFVKAVQSVAPRKVFKD